MSDFELSIDELESLIFQISSGSKIISVVTEDGEIIPVLLRQPVSDTLLMASYVYDYYFDKAGKDGFLSVDELKESLNEKGIYTKDDEVLVEELVEKIKVQRIIKSKYKIVKKRRDEVDLIILDLNNKINEIRRKLTDKFNLTKEGRAGEEKLIYLTYMGAFLLSENKRIWNSIEEFNSEPDVVFRNNVVREYSIFIGGMPIKNIRYLARNSLWRLRYIACIKTGALLFNTNVCDFSIDQLNLIYWSSYYASLQEMMPEDMPPEDIIDDDDLLDDYMKRLHEEREKDYAERRQEKQGKFSKRGAFTHEEVIITGQDPSFQDYQYTKVKKLGTGSSDFNVGREKTAGEKARQKVKDRLRGR